jgi:hypothetical protein
MAFDQSTRNRLARFVGDVRNLLTEEFTRQLQNEYGLDPESGTVTGLEKLTAQDDTKRETARILRETMDYYLAGKTDDKKNRQDVLQRIVREQAFTVLNRLCALRMAESRGILIESIAKGYQSKGFQLYARLAGTGLGETGDAYSSYLFSLFDEFAIDLAVLFDRFNPQGRLFPRQTALVKLLDLINDLEIEQLWAEDETIGWMYQYFNTKEERQDMRAASHAPRNSRELAVRNQFFTPRYVVEFLTDNTLGRIWYEMTKGETSLKNSCHYLVRRPTEMFLKDGEVAPAQESDESLSQEELLKQPVYIPHRQIKDPREIKMLDPACGSMHFGLYAFDLFEKIYAEAWDLEETLGDKDMQLGDLKSLHFAYQTREAFLCDVPRLIIECNIHGVDIDPRAVQIAGLSLWLRAQKSWHAQGVKPQDRPQIRHSNIVCAEPMPGDRALLEEFLQTFKEDRLEALMRRVLNVPNEQKVRATKAMAEALANLVRTVWQEMELAGEAGSLLQIEVTLRDAIEKASNDSKEKTPLFSVLEFGSDNSSERASLGTDGNFWNWAETLVLEALREYAGQSESDGSFRRRLFTDDATQGFAFIDLCRKQYDVALMNPPFGDGSVIARDYLDSVFSEHKDLASRFISRTIVLLANGGSLGAITTNTILSTSSASEWRLNSFVNKCKLRLFLDLGEGVLDNAMVETASYTIERSVFRKNALFFDLSEVDVQNKANKLSDTLSDFIVDNKVVFWGNPEEFSKIPGNPFSYWVSPKIRAAFKEIPAVEGKAGYVRKGLTTSDDFRFIRCWWEVDPASISLGSVYQNSRWVNINKGGGYSPFFADIHLVINWENNGKELRSFPKSYLRNETTYFKAGLSFPIKNRFRFSVKPLPLGSIYSNVGSSVFPVDFNQVYKMMALFHSKAFSFLIKIISGWNYEIGSVQNTPLPIGETIYDNELSMLAKEIIGRKREKEKEDEISHLFIAPISLLGDTSNSRKNEYLLDNEDVLFDRIDDIAYKLYNFDVKDIVQIENYLQNIIYESNNINDADVDGEEETHLISAGDLISWLFGCLFARWDIRYATGNKNVLELPDPFSPVPACSPGMLQNNQGLPVGMEDISSDYPIPLNWKGILAEDEIQPENLEKKIHEALRYIWRDNADVLETKTCQTLNVPSLRLYFQSPSLFFADHLKRYSKSHRHAPIYWPLSTPSNSYTLWLYYHRLNDQTLFTCINDFVDPKIKQVSEEAKNLRQKKSRSSAEEKDLESLTDFEHELKDFRDELLRVAKFWKPNLNDGVQITASPLWKLFQHKPWQKKLRETWESLEAGEYDWTHLAYSIWPERVREKCKSDKSLAIAHDLEHLYVETKKPAKKGSKKKIIQPEIFEEE